MRNLVSSLLLILLALSFTFPSPMIYRGQAAPALIPSDPAAPQTFYQWQPLALPEASLSISQLSVNPDNSRELYAIASGQLFHSSDAGDTWMDITPLDVDWVSQFTIAPGDSLRFYMVASDGFRRSQDGGVNWTPLPTDKCFWGLYVAPSDADVLYAEQCDHNLGTLLRSPDGGSTWETPSTMFTQNFYSFAISPTDPNLVVGNSWDTIYRSVDGGVNWQVAPTGTRYNARLVFDPQPPHTLYLGHWRGLLRSMDGGASWEDSRLEQEIIALAVSPASQELILGGSTLKSIQVAVEADSWAAADWKTPFPLTALLRAENHTEMLYAWLKISDSEWRWYRSAPVSFTEPHTVFLPTILRPDQLGSYPAEAVQALDLLNQYRARAGTAPLENHAAIVQAAYNHANYITINWNNPAAQVNGPHGEVEGQPGFTGVGVYDRMVAAGWPKDWWGGGEVVHYLGNPIQAVDGWMATIYHRVIPLDPDFTRAGYGVSVANTYYKADVLDFGGGAMTHGYWLSPMPYPMGYPADGQTGVPTSWNGLETPNPLPLGAATPVGYPFTLQGVNGTLHVTSASMTPSGGTPVSLHPNPADCLTFNCYAMIPVKPLLPNTTYVVSAAGDVEGLPFSRTWTFTTGGSLLIRTDELVGGEDR